MRVRQASLLVSAVLIVGCAGVSVPPESPLVRDELEPDVPGHEDETGDNSRVLPVGATFRDVVNAARRLEAQGESASEIPCVFSLMPSGHWRLDGDLASGVNPLPSGIPGLVDELRDRGSAWQVLSRYGAFGPADAPLSLAALTSDVPRAGDENLVLVAIDDERVVWRHMTEPSVGGESDELGEAQVGEILGADPGAILVSAEPGVSLRRVRGALGTLGEQGVRVGVAVALPLGTALPSRDALASGQTGLCAELQPLADDEPVGGRSVEALRSGLSPLLQGGASQCVESSRWSGSAEARIELHLRIVADGSVRDVCAISDETGSSSLRLCIVERVRGLRFSPAAGTDEVRLPLVLVEAERVPRRLFCEEPAS